MAKQTNIPDFIQSLPIADVVDAVRGALKNGNVLLHAEPGAGKSTGLPLTLLRDASPSNRIIMLEPRRLAAIGVAERLASQLGESLGQQVGLRMRGQTTVSANTILEVVTEGVLTRMLQADPLLEGVGWVIFDEFHERSLNADFGLALCREVQSELRPDLRLLLMSATLDAVELGASMEPIQQITCAGRSFSVDIVWLGSSRDELPRRVASAIATALAEQSGDLLVFLPGIAEIEKTGRLVEPRLDTQTVLYRLHGRADSKTQRLATAPAGSGDQTARRVILSTSIAETSLTIDGVRVVIDAGLERRGRVDSNTGAQRLETVMASQASATQRAGRAGRTAAGVCYRLWSESDHAQRATSWQAEILRSELSSLLVETGQWGASDVNALPWLEPPPPASVARAETLLTTLGLWQTGRLTDHGVAVAQLPLHPRLGHMLVWAADRGAADLASKLVVLLEDGAVKGTSTDLESHIQQTLPRHLQRRATQLLKLLKNKPAKNGTPSLAVLLAQAYPDWVARRRSGAESKYQLSCGAGAFIASVDPLAQTQWLAIASMGGAAKEPRVFLACGLDIDELESWAPHLFVVENTLAWDDRSERVVAEQQKRCGKLLVQAKTTTDISDEEKARALLTGIQKRGIACLPWTDECREWQARVTLMGRLAADKVAAGKPQKNASDQTRPDWPAVDDASLAETLESWLLVWLNGKSSLKAVAQLDLLGVLNAMLDYQQQQGLDTQLPTRYTVPSGSKVRLRYADGDSPVLSVKLQEMFGCLENPSVANGQVVLKVELLSPARRPVQLTKDLVNFWTTSYPAVKKDMAGRYPKHDWPDDPVAATPTAYAKPRKKK